MRDTGAVPRAKPPALRQCALPRPERHGSSPGPGQAGLDAVQYAFFAPPLSRTAARQRVRQAGVRGVVLLQPEK